MSQPQQREEGTEAWSTHRPSQSPSQLTQTQVNVVVICVFTASFVLNFLMSSDPTTAHQRKTSETITIENWIVVFVLTVMSFVWIILLVKVRECAVWPEEVTFRRDNLIVLELGCGYKALNTEEGVTLYRKRVHMCSGFGVWTNAVTDWNMEETFVLVPTTGPRYWRGFAFQPEDPGAFLHDCSHAGVVIADDGSIMELSEEGEYSLRQGLLSNASDLEQSNVSMGRSVSAPVQRVDSYESLTSNEETSLPEEESKSDDVIDDLKNNNIVEV